MKEGKMKYTYDEIFQRNIGVFTPEEQKRIKNLKVAIFGVGGLGAPVIENLARLGVGCMYLIEPDSFDVSNLNRQTGSYISTLGKNKAKVLASMVLDINNDIEIEVIDKKINGDDMRSCVSSVDFVVDGIDFFNINDSIELHKISKEEKKIIVSAQGCLSMISFSVYDPNKYMLSDLIKNDNKKDMTMDVVKYNFPVLPREINFNIIKDFINNMSSGESHIPSYSVLVPLSGAIMTQIIVNIFIKKENIKNIPIMPDLLYIDNNLLDIKRYHVQTK